MFLFSRLLQFISDLFYHGAWPFGEFLCKISYSAYIATVIISAFTIISMCYARFQAFCKPLHAQLKVKHAIYVIALIWAVGFAYMIPYAILLNIKTYATSSYCLLNPIWTEDARQAIYDLILFSISYALPIIAVAILNVQIIHNLKMDLIQVISNKYGNVSDGLRRHRSNGNIDLVKKKLRKMSVIIFFAYLVVWLPYWIYVFLVDTNIIKYILASIANIFICYYYNPPFNAAFKSILRFKCRNPQEITLHEFSRSTNV
ncbi:Neuropeptide FF receptor 2 [Trichoplax sp. H2]|nr:Neuropeptide FF receptor 2 [Trichoplax sp. H2]|eukprot:RDD40323.1 Neuropeptide FF receptor 2 [Trichoplax sp. H2]